MSNRRNRSRTSRKLKDDISIVIIQVRVKPEIILRFYMVAGEGKYYVI